MNAVAFGDLAAGVWGVTLDRLALLATPGESLALEASIDAGDESWRLAIAGVELEFTGLGEAARSDSGFDQLCRVSGRVPGLDGELSCLGWRGQHPVVQTAGTTRSVWGWFAPAGGVALEAVRPPRVGDHGADELNAVVFDDGTAIPVVEPRLSTTYRADGSPGRTSLELWLPLDDDEDSLYPRRVAGETAAGSITARLADGRSVQATPLRCHSRGLDGAGIYLLSGER